MSNITVRFAEDAAFRNGLDTALARHNDAHSHWHHSIRTTGGQPVELEVRNSETLVAGLYGEIYWHSLEIDRLWVAEGSRRQGLGTALIQRIEALARDQQCRFIHLTTFSFQAPDMYRSLGYSQVGEMTDFPPGFNKYWFRKDLTDESDTESADKRKR